MAITVNEAIRRAKKLVADDWNYVYGAKYNDNPITVKLINRLRAENSQVYTHNYYTKALTKVGKNAIDCSGLVCHCWGISDIGSWSIHYLPNEKPNSYASVSLKELIAGDAVWKSGHVGLYIGNGKVIEARGIDYGVQITNLTDQLWKHGIRKKDFKEAYDYENLGWNEDTKGWWYAYGHFKGEYYKNEIACINGKYYAFDADGYMCYRGTFNTNSKGEIITIQNQF